MQDISFSVTGKMIPVDSENSLVDAVARVRDNGKPDEIITLLYHLLREDEYCRFVILNAVLRYLNENELYEKEFFEAFKQLKK